MAKYRIYDCEKTERITKLVDALFDKMPEIESERGFLSFFSIICRIISLPPLPSTNCKAELSASAPR